MKSLLLLTTLCSLGPLAYSQPLGSLQDVPENVYDRPVMDDFKSFQQIVKSYESPSQLKYMIEQLVREVGRLHEEGKGLLSEEVQALYNKMQYLLGELERRSKLENEKTPQQDKYFPNFPPKITYKYNPSLGSDYI